MSWYSNFGTTSRGTAPLAEFRDSSRGQCVSTPSSLVLLIPNLQFNLPCLPASRFYVYDSKCSHDRSEVQLFADNGSEHVHLADRDRASGNGYLARYTLRDHQSNLVDHVDAGRTDLSVQPHGIAFTFGGFVTANGWPERDAVVQFVVCQVDCFLDETTVRRYHSELIPLHSDQSCKLNKHLVTWRSHLLLQTSEFPIKLATVYQLIRKRSPYAEKYALHSSKCYLSHVFRNFIYEAYRKYVIYSKELRIFRSRTLN